MYLLMFLLSVDIIVGKHQVADGEGEYRNWDGNAVEESPGDLPVVQVGDHHLRLQAGVEAGKVKSLSSVGK